MLEAKFRGVIRLIEPLAGTAARAVPLHWRIDVVVPVPPDRSLLRRVRETPPQTALSASRQATNLRGAFAVVGAPPERVLLVDNVTTTESTFDEAAGALLRARAATVYALAIGCED
ncbi:MAG TPA: hypothetical protein QGI71_04365 [Dehalococcoidia bacterium]|nr:hypothetical protein [Dehalococcoidia bacterium]